MGARAERQHRYTPITRIGLAEEDLDQHDAEIADHENRLRGLEGIASKVLGAAAAGGVTAGAVGVVLQVVLG